MLELTREEPFKDRLSAYPEVTDVEKHSSLLEAKLITAAKSFILQVLVSMS
jgi:hypothetical protein